MHYKIVNFDKPELNLLLKMVKILEFLILREFLKVFWCTSKVQYTRFVEVSNLRNSKRNILRKITNDKVPKWAWNGKTKILKLIRMMYLVECQEK